MNSYDGSLDKRALDAYITGGHGQDDDPADEMEAWQETVSELSAERDDLAARLVATTKERDALVQAGRADLEAFNRIVALVQDAQRGKDDVDAVLDIILDIASMPALREWLVAE